MINSAEYRHDRNMCVFNYLSLADTICLKKRRAYYKLLELHLQSESTEYKAYEVSTESK